MTPQLALDHTELKAALTAWISSQGYTLNPDATFTLDPATGNVVVTGYSQSPIVVPAPVVADAIKDPGPPYSLKCLATCFGYQDPGDDGLGAWGADTNNTSIVGVAVPIPILIASLGGVQAHFIAGYTVSVICLDTNKSLNKVDIVDDGPGESVNGQHGLLVGKDGVLHALDLTYGLCQKLGVKYDANTGGVNVIWWLEDPNGKPVEMKGLDAPRKTVG